MHIGIDPGLHGAIACVSSPSDPNPRVWDTPVVPVIRNRKKRNQYLVRNMLEILEDAIGSDDKHHICIEQVSSMPKQGVASMFSLGRGAGLWEGLVVSFGVPYTTVLPRQWKKEMLRGMDHSSKNDSLIRARQLYPSVELNLAKHEGRAEALMIAAYSAKFYAESSAKLQ